MEAWWLNPESSNRVRSSPAMERDIEEFMRRTGQTVECVLTHGLVTAFDYAQNLWPKTGTCGACKAAL